jgi:hypothetical protein
MRVGRAGSKCQKFSGGEFFFGPGVSIYARPTPRIYPFSVTDSFIFVCSRYLRVFGHVPTPNSHYRHGPGFKKQIFQRQQSGLYPTRGCGNKKMNKIRTVLWEEIKPSKRIFLCVTCQSKS